jgi:hypothetical protein
MKISVQLYFQGKSSRYPFVGRQNRSDPGYPGCNGNSLILNITQIAQTVRKLLVSDNVLGLYVARLQGRVNSLLIDLYSIIYVSLLVLCSDYRTCFR